MRKILGVLVLGLAACSSVNPVTALRLARLSPLEVDPGQIAVAVTLPPGMRAKPRGAHLTVQAVREDGRAGLDGSYLLDARAPLQGASVAAAGLPAALAEDGATTTLYRLAERDAVAMRGLQAKAREWQGETPPVKGSATIGLGLEACAIDGGPAPDARGSAYIRTGAGEDFLPLIEMQELRYLLGPDALAALPPCESAR